MQDFLTYAIDAIATSAAIYFSAMFMLGLQCRKPAIVQPTSDVQLDEIKQVQPAPLEAVPDIANPLWEALTPHDLRQTCQKSGIRWRNAKGKKKHLTKAEMIAALEAIPRSA
jgi:hypothetical protein